MSEKFTVKCDPEYAHFYHVYLGCHLVGRIYQRGDSVIGEAFIRGIKLTAYESWTNDGLLSDVSRDHCLNEACKGIRRALEENGGPEERVFEFEEGPL